MPVPSLLDRPAPLVVAATARASRPTRQSSTLAAALLGFFVVTLDAVVVNVALPAIRHQFGAGITGLQWVIDGYTLLFAALLLWSGALADRVGARRMFTIGLAGFVLASAACGVAPTLAALVAARFVQGAAAAVMMPASMALIGHAYPDPGRRARAIGMWAMGGALASSAGPVLGGVLTLVSWRLIFFINVPVGLAALCLVARIAPSPRFRVPFDYAGQVTGVVAMAALTYGAIEAGAAGFGAGRVLTAFGVAVVASITFLVRERRAADPMVPLWMFRRRNVSVSVAVGFAFVVGYYGLPFVMSLYLQQQRGLSSFAVGLTFMPMMLVGAVLTPLSARLAERVGAHATVTSGLGVMAAGLVVLAVVPSTTAVGVLAVLMIFVGIAGPLVIPPVTAVLLNSVPGRQSGTASGVFNTSRQIGGALAVAVFGALLSHGTLAHGVRISLLVAAGVAGLTAIPSFLLRPAESAPPRAEGI